MKKAYQPHIGPSTGSDNSVVEGDMKILSPTWSATVGFLNGPPGANFSLLVAR